MSAISFTSDNAKGDCPGVLAKGGSTGVIFVQEWWGMNDAIIERGKYFAKRSNFTVLVPDLYRGKVATDHETAGHYMSSLDWAGAVKDIQGAARYLLANGCTGVGVTGFCMGGALSLAAAAMQVPEIKAAAPFYGIPSSKLCDIKKIKMPLQCHFGEKDHVAGFSSPADYNLLKENLTAAGVKFEWFTYDAGHAFVNPTADNYDKACAELALSRVEEFFKESISKL